MTPGTGAPVESEDVYPTVIMLQENAEGVVGLEGV